MIASITKDGVLHWYCPGKTCAHHPDTGVARSAHISELATSPQDPSMVHLPLCECGVQLSIKVHFTEEELEEERSDLGPGKRLRHHSAVPRHQELARQLARKEKDSPS